MPISGEVGGANSAARARGWRRTSPAAAAATIAAIGLAVSWAAFFSARKLESQENRRAFVLAAEQRIALAQSRLLALQNSLLVMRGFLESHPPTQGAGGFERTSEELIQAYPSVRAVQWAPRVTAEQRAAYEQRRGGPILEGTPPQQLSRAGRRADHYPVDRIYPADAAARIGGLDLESEVVVREAGNRARERYSLGATPPLPVVSEMGGGEGLVVSLAVRGQGTPGTAGILAAVVDMHELLERALQPLEPRGVSLTFLDRSAPPQRQLIHFHRSRLGDSEARPAVDAGLSAPMAHTAKLEFGGREWLVVATPAAGSGAGRVHSTLVGLVGLLCTGLLAVYFGLSAAYNRRRERLAADLELANRELANEVEQHAAARRDLAAARDQALRMSHLKSQFLANVSHEIRTPLNGIIGMSSLLADTQLTPEQSEFADTIRKSGLALLAIVNDLLDVSRIESGKLSVHPHSFDPRELASGVCRLLKDRAEAKNLTLTLDIDARVPERLLGDSGRIRQVLVNLVGNGLKFTEAGRVAVDVRLDSPPGDPRTMVRFEVTDTGIGIAEQDWPNLFQPFSQVDATSTRRYGGTGLGLAISKQLVELMGGEIGMDSRPGEGSRFWFRLPLPVATPSTPGAPSPLAANP